MRIAVVNSNVKFGASIKKTENGNEYTSTNVAKVVLPSLSALSLLMEKPYGVNRTASSIIFSLAMSTGLGFLLDHLVDKTRQEDADIFAQTGEVSDKTHKGLGVGAAVGAGFGAICSLLLKATGQSKALNLGPLVLLLIPALAVGGLIDGALFYDLRVNKTRKELAIKAEVNEQIQQGIEEYKEKENTKKSDN